MPEWKQQLPTQDQASRLFNLNKIDKEQYDRLMQTLPKADAPNQGLAMPAAANISPSTRQDLLQFDPANYPETAPKPAESSLFGSLFQPDPVQTAGTAGSTTLVDQAPYLGKTALDLQNQQNALNPLANFSGAYDTMAAGMEQQAKAISNAELEKAELFKSQADLMKKQGEDEELRSIATQKRSEDGIRKIDEKVADLESFSFDKDRFWKNRTTGDKILIGVGLLLGSFGAGSGGGNRAVQVLDNAIESDINAQKADYLKKKDSVEQQKTLYGEMMQKFKDERAARDAIRLLGLKEAELKLNEIGSRYGSPQAQGKLKEAQGQLELQKQATMVSLQAALNKNDPNKEPVDDPLWVRGWGRAATKERADKAIELAGSTEELHSSIDDIIKTVESTGPFDKQKKDLIEQKLALLRSKSREEILGPGTMTNEEYERLVSIIANPKGLFTRESTAIAKLKEIGMSANRRLFAKMRYLVPYSKPEVLKSREVK